MLIRKIVYALGVAVMLGTGYVSIDGKGGNNEVNMADIKHIVDNYTILKRIL